MKETKQFQTESKQLLNLVINSIYSNKEIFLREIISNASDAIDKYRFLSLKEENGLKTKEHKIRITLNKDEKYIEISDDGIGMTKGELETNLGTIAKSGSKEFLSKLKESEDKKDIGIIGQFGVGFYSAFMVAKKVEVLTKSYKCDEAYMFESDGIETYSIEEAQREESGSTIRIYLKDDTEDEKYSTYLDQYVIKNIVKKYSDYIRYPIVMAMEKSRAKKDENGNEIKGEYEKYYEDETLNSMVPLWKKNKSEVSEQELNEYYKNRFNDYEDPTLSLFLDVEGLICYKALVYIPSHAPYNLYSDTYEKGLALYAKDVFIKEKCPELVPDYLKFLKGLVDSDDFSLNVSREILQDDKRLHKISDNIEKKVIDGLKDLKNKDYDKYLKFFDTFGANIKFGIYQSFGSKKDLLKDLLVYDTLLSDKKISLEEYKKNAKEGQKVIYYAAGKTLESVKLLPQIEKYKQSGTDVLLLHENIDEFTLLVMKDYEGLEFKSITAESNDELSKEEKDKIDSLSAQNRELLDILKENLKDKVDDVVFSAKLVDAPVCISSKDGVSLNIEHVMNEQDPTGKDQVKAIKVLEINPDHTLFKTISSNKESGKDISKYASLLYDEAMLLEGYDIKDKAQFVNNLNSLLADK
ncbi:MAG TPA: molecular chaperone HtpG [Firmicutes bacterium]|nr:molecular chaperone HtpG [Bacillota bacterium]HAW99651.1 molecular chaperone HtpG [Bacillota bacterium]